jgi:4'-phosphopantetheinyl transferase
VPIELVLRQLDLAPQSLARAESLLSIDERERAARFHFRIHRDRFVAGRALLRETLARATGRAPAEIVFRYGRWGKPSVDGILFNASNSGDCVLIALTFDDVEIGVDLEAIRPLSDRDGLVEHFFRPDERTTWESVPHAQRDQAFFRWWTAKEAYVKATGEGLGGAAPEVGIDFHPERPLAFLAPSPWTLRTIDAPAGFVAALCLTSRLTCSLTYPLTYQ